MDWFVFCKYYYDLGIANKDNLKIYIARGKITAEEYKQITGMDYEA
ncbi:XkdX family protein [Clostridium sp. AWRP]|nr:XkdX family protein [Clostridium sp. AWRP]AZV57911.1 XkdX family protein [Clostridium sp. AWRP]